MVARVPYERSWMTDDNGSKRRGQRILLVGGERSAARSAGDVLIREGYRVDVIDAEHAPRPLTEVDLTGNPVVISDVDQGEAATVSVLRAIRRESRATPFILLSADPSVRAATAAFDSRAFSCVRKPVDHDELLHVVRRSALQQQLGAASAAPPPATPHAPAPGVPSVPTDAPDPAGAEVAVAMSAGASEDASIAPLAERFDSALASLWMAFQPLIDRAWGIYGYEALLRTDEPTLRSPPDFLKAAEDLGRAGELSELIWERAAEPFLTVEPSAVLFMNIDPHQLTLEPLFPKTHPVRMLADRVVFEVRAQSFALEDDEVLDRLARLRSRGFRIAIDDLGAGSSGLASLAQIEPDFVKLDSLLVRGVEVHDRKQRLVRSLQGLCSDLDIECIAMGVETRKEFESLTQLGVGMFQGFFVGRPMPWGASQDGDG